MNLLQNFDGDVKIRLLLGYFPWKLLRARKAIFEDKNCPKKFFSNPANKCTQNQQ